MNARPNLFLWLLVGGLLPQCAEAQDNTIRFSGEVAQGLTYRKSIGHGLDFVLKPLPMPQSGDLTGWTMQVSPHGAVSDPKCTDYLWVVTPPFRFWNHRYLSTEYGNTAQEAVGFSPREFNFVLNCDDFKKERRQLDFVLWPASQEELVKSVAKLGLSPQGTGSLRIRDSKFTPGDKSTDPVKLGEIHWIKFEVEIRLPK